MPVDGSGEWFVLLTESFAVRAMLGSLAAAALAALAVRAGLVHSSRARRLIVLAPVLTAACAGVASIGETYLPQLWVSTAADGSAAHLLELLGELRVMAPGGRINLLILAYSAVVGALLARRLLGLLVARRVLWRAGPPVGYGSLVPVLHRLSASMRIQSPRLVMLEACPGGALTFGTWRPVVVVDPHLVDALDDRELEGLLAHELAHISRRDTLLGLLVGVFRDVTFFLPPVHLAARWLRREQEESADELASAHTQRPVALASSILKVWDASRSHGQLQAACAAVPGRRLALAGGVPAPPLRGPAKIISDRVERLIDRPPAVPNWRRAAEVVLAGAVTVTAVSAAIGVPTWLLREYDAAGLALGYLSTPPARTVESPAFATFRELAPERTPVSRRTTNPDAAARRPSPGAVTERPSCPCVASRAEIAQRVPAGGDAGRRGMVWSSADHDLWRVGGAHADANIMPAWPLLTLSDAEQQVGFFVVGPTGDVTNS